MSADAVETWVSRLTEGSDEAWNDFGALAPTVAVEVVHALKRAVDERVRSAPPEALPLAEALVRASERTPQLRALAVRGRAVAAHFNGDHESALADFVEAARLHAEGGERLEAAIAQRSLIEVCHQLGNSEAAFEWADRSRAILVELGAEERLAELEVNVGNIYTSLDEYARARDHYESARAHFHACDHVLGVAYSDYNLAVVLMNLGELRAAERCWRTARGGLAAAGHEVHVADCDYSLAYLDFRRERFRAAIAGLQAARASYAENGKPSGVPMCELDLAEVHLTLGAGEEALEHASRAAKAFESLGHEIDRARAERLEGAALLALGDLDGAVAALDRAAQRFLSQGHRVGRIAAELTRVAVEIEADRSKQALERLEAAVAELTEQDSPHLRTAAILARAEAALRTGDPAAAERLALPVADSPAASGGLPRLFAYQAAGLVGRARVAADNRSGAIEAFNRCIALVDSAWMRIPTRELRTAFFRSPHSVFVDLALLHADRAGGERTALTLLEAGRMRSDLADDQVVARRFAVQAALNRELEGGRELPFGTPATPIEPARQLATEDIATQVGRALAPGEVGLEFVLRGDDVRVFIVDGDDVRAVHLETTTEEITAIRDRLVFHFDRHGFAGAAAIRRAVEAAMAAELENLGRRLLEPIMGAIRDRRVIVVPYGPLRDLPLHAARVEGRSLAQQCELSYALGLAHMSRRRRGPVGNGRWLVAGRTDDTDLEAVEGEIEALEDLRRVALESRANAANGAETLERPAVEQPALEQPAFDQPAVEPATEENATNAARPSGSEPRSVLDEVDRERLTDGTVVRGELLHVAAHGDFVRSHPSLSSIGVGDGVLYAEDVLRGRFEVDLVTLSGCETGRLSRHEGEDYVGLVQAFLQSGARSVVASGWPVPDEDASRFMQLFYREAVRGGDLIAAVTRVWRSLEDLGYGPNCWAAFALYGAPNVRLSTMTAPADRL